MCVILSYLYSKKMDALHIYYTLGRDVHVTIYNNIDIYDVLTLLSVDRYHNNIIKQLDAYIIFSRLKVKLTNSDTYRAITGAEVKKAYFIYKAIKHGYVDIYRTLLHKSDHRVSYYTALLYSGINGGDKTYHNDIYLARTTKMRITIQMRYEIRVIAQYAFMNNLSSKHLFVAIVHGCIPADLHISAIIRKIDSLLK